MTARKKPPYQNDVSLWVAKHMKAMANAIRNAQRHRKPIEPVAEAALEAAWADVPSLLERLGLEPDKESDDGS